MVEKQLTQQAAEKLAATTIRSALEARGLNHTEFAVDAVAATAAKLFRSKPELIANLRDMVKENKVPKKEEVKTEGAVDQAAAERKQAYARVIQLRAETSSLQGEGNRIIDEVREGNGNLAEASKAFGAVLEKLRENAKQRKIPGADSGESIMKKNFLNAVQDHLTKTKNEEFIENKMIFDKYRNQMYKTPEEKAKFEEVTRKLEEIIERETKGLFKFQKHED